MLHMLLARQYEAGSGPVVGSNVSGYRSREGLGFQELTAGPTVEDGWSSSPIDELCEGFFIDAEFSIGGAILCGVVALRRCETTCLL